MAELLFKRGKIQYCNITVIIEIVYYNHCTLWVSLVIFYTGTKVFFCWYSCTKWFSNASSYTVTVDFSPQVVFAIPPVQHGCCLNKSGSFGSLLLQRSALFLIRRYFRSVLTLCWQMCDSPSGAWLLQLQLHVVELLLGCGTNGNIDVCHTFAARPFRKWCLRGENEHCSCQCKSKNLLIKLCAASSVA